LEKYFLFGHKYPTGILKPIPHSIHYSFSVHAPCLYTMGPSELKASSNAQKALDEAIVGASQVT
jgi:hypothetical protein